MNIQIQITPVAEKTFPESSPIVVHWKGRTLVIAYTESASSLQVVAALSAELEQRENSLRVKRLPSTQ